MEQHVVPNKDAQLYTLVAGKNEQETVMLLHGGPAVPENLNPIINFLAKKYRIVYFHQRGTGKSPCSSNDYSMKSYISDIDCVASFFKIEKFHLFGHSWGGLYAGIYAEERQEKLLSLFLSSPASGAGKQWAKMSMEVRRFQKQKSTTREWLGMLMNSSLGMLGFKSRLKEFYKQFAINCNKGFEVEKTAPLLLDFLSVKAAKGTNKGILKYGSLPEFKNPRIKITVTYGEDDIYGSSVQYVKQRYPTAEIITIPSCGHIQWLHNTEAFFNELAQHFSFFNN